MLLYVKKKNINNEIRLVSFFTRLKWLPGSTLSPASGIPRYCYDRKDSYSRSSYEDVVVITTFTASIMPDHTTAPLQCRP
jgi:hypothetical protein